jgi:hypothetical protein
MVLLGGESLIGADTPHLVGLGVWLSDLAPEYHPPLKIVMHSIMKDNEKGEQGMYNCSAPGWNARYQ